MDSTTQVVTALIIVAAAAASLILTQFARRRGELFPVRAIAAYDAIPTMVGIAIEAGRPLHLSIGSAGLGGAETPLTLATADLLYEVSRRAATGSVPPILTLSNTTALPLAYSTLRRAYRSRGRLDRLDGASVRWFPAGARSLAFAAALTGVMGYERVSGNVLVGSFGAELALALDKATRRQNVIAASSQLEGQAAAWALADYPLIGEEMFVGGAYLNPDSAGRRAAVRALDLLRWALIIGLLIAAANTLREPVAAALQRLLGG